MDQIDAEKIVIALLAIPILQKRSTPDALGAVAVYEKVRRELVEAKIISPHD